MSTKAKKNTVVKAVFSFVRGRTQRADPTFTTKDLNTFVGRKVMCAAGTPARTLRALARTGQVGYDVALGTKPPRYNAVYAY